MPMLIGGNGKKKAAERYPVSRLVRHGSSTYCYSYPCACFHHYPTSTFAIGEASVTCYAVPALSVLFAAFGWLGLRKSNQFFILTLLAFTILFLITGVMGHGWYLPEISAIFLAMGILSGFANSEKQITSSGNSWTEPKICYQLPSW